MLTKLEEKNLLTTICAQLPPESYLSSLFGEVYGPMLRAIDNDFGVIGYEDMQRQKAELAATVDTLTKKANELQAEIKRLERTKDAHERYLQDIRRRAERLAQGDV